ncbi:MAG: 16S rRNA (cytosine(967)-C(5))-methyltransferase RsmB [Candidatus Marinimicrobia bacterium]|nr:16S rRNA (cytosine(967)-C(5))-methyltransferase RsmB [Candidatus Neomarinimicrobiota bacterium]
MKARTAAVIILNKLNDRFYGYEEVMEKFFRTERFKPEDRHFIHTLVKGTIEQSAFLDFVISNTYQGNFRNLEKITLNILRLGVFQAKILRTPVHAYVNETVNVTKELKAERITGLINGVLRNIISDKEIETIFSKVTPLKKLAIKYSFQQWMIEKWFLDFGQENTIKLLEYYNSAPEIFFRVNPLRANPGTFFTLLKNKGFKVQVHSEKPGQFFTVDNAAKLLSGDLFQKGFISVQDMSQAFAVELLRPAIGERILDVCAAPGGKSTYLAQLTQNLGHIKSYDLSFEKLKLMKAEMQRQEITCIETFEADATKFQFSPADKILVDAPCTGTGVLGRKADLRWSRQPGDITKTNLLQKEILANAAKSLKPGGILVYSTCSLEKEENQTIVEDFLINNPDFKLEPADKYVDKKYCDSKGFVTILPFQHLMSGGFAARLKKDVK